MLGGDEREGEKKKKTIGLREVKTETFWEERNGVGEMEREREEEIFDFRKSEERNRIGQKEERWERISGLRYNK